MACPDHHIAIYRQKAEECRQEAEKSPLNSLDKEAWLRLANDWTQMAQEVERRLGVARTDGERRRTVMENPDRAQIMKRAYELWEQAGMPEGRAEEFYHLAEEELRNKEKSNPLPPDKHET